MDNSYKYFHTNQGVKGDEKQESVFNSFFNPTQSTNNGSNFFGSQNPFDVNYTPNQSNVFNSSAFQQPRDNFDDGFTEAFATNKPFYQYPPGMGTGFFSSQTVEKKHEDIRRTAQFPIDNDFSRKLIEKTQKSHDFFGESSEFTPQQHTRNELMPQTVHQPYSVSPMIQPVSRPLGQIKQPFSPQIMARTLASKSTLNNIKKEKRGSIPATKVEEIMGTIETYKINPISLLNEISTKIKKRVDYGMTESPFGKIRVFECICKLDKETIGNGKGNSKQAAKTEAAKEGVKTLLSKESYMPERAAIILSVQKTSGQIIAGPQFQNISPIDSPNLGASSQLHQDYVIPKPFKDVLRQGSGDFSRGGISSSPNVSHMSNESDHMNDSPLYELNVIAKECFIEPQWTVTNLPNNNGEFEAELKFDKLVAIGKGRKKQDAKREAAANIIAQIRLNPQLKEKFNPKNQTMHHKKFSKFEEKPLPRFGQSLDGIKEKKRRFFESAIEAKYFEDLSKKDNFSKDDLKKMNNSFETHLLELTKKYSPEFLKLEHSREFFKKIVDYTSMSIVNPKQVMLHSDKHLADLVIDCNLVPIGAFALECLRNEKMVMDALITFREKGTKLSDLDFLGLLRDSLEDCLLLDETNGLLTMDFDFEILTIKNGNGEEVCYLQIVEKSKFTKVNVFVSNVTKMEREKSNFLFAGRYDYTIVHLKRMFQCFEDTPEEFKQFRNLLSAMRIWRDRCGLDFLRTEVLDILLLNDYINNKCVNLPGSIVNCLMILDYEEITRDVLMKFDRFYEHLYDKMSEEQKKKLLSAAGKTLYTLFRQNFSEAKFA